MDIRKIEEKDKQSIFEMMKVFYASPAILNKPSEQILLCVIDDCIKNSPYLEGFVAQDQNKIVGYCMVAKSYSTEFGGLCIWIEDMYFLPEFRKKGFGTQMFEFVEARYKNQAVRIRLEVEPKNLQAIKLYERQGYRILPYIEMTKE